MTTIRVSALVFLNDDHEVLTVRKRGTSGFMLPGGKPEPGESPVQTAIREVAEELGIDVAESQLRHLGQFEEAALNEPGMTVQAQVFLAEVEGMGWTKVHPQAEIAQIRWVHPQKGNFEQQAPLNVRAIFPALLEAVPAYRKVESVAVFCGSSAGRNPLFARQARCLGRELAQRDIALVYGGSRSGLMGEVASGALDAGGDVYGVMPRFMVEREHAHAGLTHLEMVETMHERKARMAALADVFVAFPGGPGTLEEFFEVWTWRYLGVHQKPVFLLNVEGYWNPLLEMVAQAHEEGYAHAGYLDSLTVVGSVQELLEKLGS